MSSIVYACTMRTSMKENLLKKIDRLLGHLDLEGRIAARDLVAIKLHFGERGNTGFIRPILIRPVVEAVKRLQAVPFLTDANTLYAGARSDAARHLQTAVENGFAYSVVGAPLVIADGLKGEAYVETPIGLEEVDTAYIGSAVAEADALVSVAHFKLHELAGFGGAIKNVGMGCAARRGKLAQHSNISPKVKQKRCIGCGDCYRHCAHSAIDMIDVEGKKKAMIQPERCVGCGECILACPQGAVQIQWNETIPVFMKKMVEYTAAVLEGKRDKSVFINFLTQITPACDCVPYSDAPLVRDIGVLASHDPIAIDQASVDLMNREGCLSGTCLESAPGPGEDKVRGVYPYIDWEIQLAYGRKVGLGTTDYVLEWLEEK